MPTLAAPVLSADGTSADSAADVQTQKLIPPARAKTSTPIMGHLAFEKQNASFTAVFAETVVLIIIGLAASEDPNEDLAGNRDWHKTLLNICRRRNNPHHLGECPRLFLLFSEELHARDLSGCQNLPGAHQ
ncbi:hypothetical protein CBOM_04260 [Ceraceosorus bombacis]|uniref:Uncharacterized protein n=1 Tax=Ceraceosorus bombacis TaxID=401625 RepID=A0A0P1BN08_9BASI|nr:hypothetical protein CBOM_04260 [Ceraceosorus bombacis]